MICQRNLVRNTSYIRTNYGLKFRKVIKEVEETYYVASDGLEFDDEHKCREHENELAINQAKIDFDYKKSDDYKFELTYHQNLHNKFAQCMHKILYFDYGANRTKDAGDYLLSNVIKTIERELEDKLIKTITDASEVEIPEALVEREIDSMVQQTSYRLMYQGLKFEDYLKYTGQTMEAYREGCKESAKDHVKTQLVIDKIITDEKIDVTEEEIEAKLAEQAESVGKSLKEYRKSVNDKQISYIENGIIIDKLFKFLKENNEIGAPAKKPAAKKATTAKATATKTTTAKKTTTKKTTTAKKAAEKVEE